MAGNQNKSANQKAGSIVTLLQRGYARHTSRRFLSAFFLFAGMVLMGISLLVAAENTYYLSSVAKTGFTVAVLLAAMITVYKVHQKQTYRSFQEFYSVFLTAYLSRPGVLSAIDLYLHPALSPSRFYETAITANTEDVNLDELQNELYQFHKQSKEYQSYRRHTGLGMISAAAAILLISLYPDGVARGLQFWTSYQQPNPYTFSITPGDTTIQHGSTFSPRVTFNQNRRPDQIYLAYKTGVEENFRIRPMDSAGTDSIFTTDIELTKNIRYYIEMDEFTSPEYRVNVQLQPRFDELIATITPPSYTGLSGQTREYPFSDIRFYPGSTIDFEGTTNKPIRTMELVTGSGETRLPANDTTQTAFKTSLTPQKTDTIRFRMTDEDGLSNQNTFRSVLILREDEAPSVVIREPTGTVMETNPGELNIEYRATDDFGLTRAQIRWELNRAFVEKGETQTKPISIPRNGSTQLETWDLSEINLRPRDELTFRIRVWDNDAYSGAKWSESQPVVIQVPSMTEYFEDLDRREREVDDGLDTISEQFRDMEQEYERFLEELRQNPEGGFSQEQNLEEIREQQKSMDESVQKLNEQFAKIRSELENNRSISEETRRNYRELQQLMEELDDPALREAMEELQKALQNMSAEQLEQAMEEVRFNEELYRERLERTVELFKRLKMNSDLDKLARQYEDMAERLEEDEERELPQLSDELGTIREEMDRLDEQLSNLDRNPPKRSEAKLRELKEEGLRDLENLKIETGRLQEEVSESSEEGETSPSEKMEEKQNQLRENLQAQAENFRSSIQQMSGQQINVNILALQQALFQLLELSDVQEYIAETATKTRSRSQGFVELARLQKNIGDQFEVVGDTLFQVSSEIPGIPNQINRKKLDIERILSRSMDQMTERNQRGSSISSREALGGMNDLASMIASLIDQLMNQQGGGGGGMSMQQMVEQLQQMSGDQQQLNQRLQEMINDVQGDRLTREESERMEQLARQQNEIRKRLQQLQQSGALGQGDRTLSELQRMLEDMEDSINDMRGGVTDPIMAERQQNILSRMLNAEEALQQRGEEDEREGTRADELERSIPPDITLEELQQEIRSRLQDPNFTQFSERYQRLIERYFEQLRRLDDEPSPPSER